MPMPPSQRAMNCGFGARIFGLSSATAQSWATTATPPPIAALLPLMVAATATSATPRAARMNLPSLTVGFFRDFVVDAHESREPADKGADDREQRPCVHPAIEEPAARAEQEDGDREVECHPEVLVALTVALRLGSFVFLCGSHVAPGNLEACEIFRKQIVRCTTISTATV